MTPTHPVTGRRRILVQHREESVQQSLAALPRQQCAAPASEAPEAPEQPLPPPPPPPPPSPAPQDPPIYRALLTAWAERGRALPGRHDPEWARLAAPAVRPGQFSAGAFGAEQFRPEQFSAGRDPRDAGR
ncbi:hypothetical protein ACIQNU_22515 [Streptomyces sp. NPDC091292]|uniref:hypothetical protein n=1 Tax=Streptomyces sp. NPDC091292 TaxID=3365991 RepID=UPI00380DB33F